ncbi:FecR domain-containing protein [Fulvimarina pelagi]|nr:FecR domain-containing protein [Fulvimarina pelagi]
MTTLAKTSTTLARAILAALLIISVPMPAMAQVFPDCEETLEDNPERTIYDCSNGLAFEAEAAAAFTGDLSDDVLTLDAQAVLIDGVPQGGDFQILTPHAIATVRGTVFTVDVAEAMTSVFVVEGVVEVTRRDGSEAVSLEAGEGVDVASGEALEARTWPDQRVDELLARFGR